MKKPNSSPTLPVYEGNYRPQHEVEADIEKYNAAVNYMNGYLFNGYLEDLFSGLIRDLNQSEKKLSSIAEET